VFRAFVFFNGNKTDLGTLGGTNGEALAINKNGQVVGDSDTAEGSVHAFVFDNSRLRDLGTLPGFEKASYARAINNSGDIVGESDSTDQKRAFLYTKGQLVELDKVAGNLAEAGFASLDVAYGISDKGSIVGYGTSTDNSIVAFVAVPEDTGGRALAREVEQRRGEQQVEPPQSQDSGQGQNMSEQNETNYDIFYNRLSSDEGDWVEAGNYGYCFRPRVSGDWRPYRDGHWVWTDRGWYWDSNESFAWATYHYGRWVDIRGTGWCWVPGNQWAPAWVSWRESDEDVGWAPLPPEAEVSGNGSISSWSDSYYGIGPAAYTFISYSHWHEPSYVRYAEPPERNVRIIGATRNVTNIVTSNNVIHNFGPPIQAIAAKTNRNIQQVKLGLNVATDSKAKFGRTLQGNQLKVVAPSVTLKPQATQAPPVQKRIENPRVEKGWQGVKPQDAEKLKTTIAGQNPSPKGLPKPTPFVKPRIGGKGFGSPGTTGSSTAVPRQNTPPNLVKPGARLPNGNVTSVGSPNAPVTEKKLLPPNLLGAKPSGTHAGPGLEKRSGEKPSVIPGVAPPEAGGKPATPGPSVLKQSPGGNVPEVSPSVPKTQPAQRDISAPKPPLEPMVPAKSAAEVKPPAPPKQETKAPLPQVQHAAAPQPQVQHAPAGPPQAYKAPPQKQEIKTPPPPQVQHAAAPQPQVQHAPAAHPQAHKAPPQKQEIKTPPPPQAQHAAAPRPQVQHAPDAHPQAHKAPPQKREIKPPPPHVQHAAAPQPQVQHAPAAHPQAHKAPPSREAQKHEAAKGKPTPKP
jgi:probable HAF family extracellular repeat protein